MDIVDLLKKRAEEIGDDWSDYDLLLKAANEIEELRKLLETGMI